MDIKTENQLCALAHDICTQSRVPQELTLQGTHELLSFLTDINEHSTAMRIMAILTGDEELITIGKIIHNRHNIDGYLSYGNGLMRQGLTEVIKEQYPSIWNTFSKNL